MKYYVVYELYVGGTDEKRVICIRDKREDAQLVLEALEKTNFSFDTYKIEIVNRDIRKEGK